MNSIWALVGVALGMGAGLLAQSHGEWVVRHPGTILLAMGAITLAAMVLVHVRQGAFERGHAERAEAFRIAMLEQFAPERLDRAG